MWHLVRGGAHLRRGLLVDDLLADLFHGHFINDEEKSDCTRFRLRAQKCIHYIIVSVVFTAEVSLLSWKVGLFFVNYIVPGGILQRGGRFGLGLIINFDKLLEERFGGREWARCGNKDGFD